MNVHQSPKSKRDTAGVVKHTNLLPVPMLTETLNSASRLIVVFVPTLPHTQPLNHFPCHHTSLESTTHNFLFASR